VLLACQPWLFRCGLALAFASCFLWFVCAACAAVASFVCCALLVCASLFVRVLAWLCFQPASRACSAAVSLLFCFPASFGAFVLPLLQPRRLLCAARLRLSVRLGARVAVLPACLPWLFRCGLALAFCCLLSFVRSCSFCCSRVACCAFLGCAFLFVWVLVLLCFLPAGRFCFAAVSPSLFAVCFLLGCAPPAAFAAAVLSALVCALSFLGVLACFCCSAWSPACSALGWVLFGFAWGLLPFWFPLFVLWRSVFWPLSLPFLLLWGGLLCRDPLVPPLPVLQVCA
jgi:hypothetical protein